MKKQPKTSHNFTARKRRFVFKFNDILLPNRFRQTIKRNLNYFRSLPHWYVKLQMHAWVILGFYTYY